MKPSVLLIGNSSALSKLIQESLAVTGRDAFHLECATRLSEGIERLEKGGIEAILLDLGLPDSEGMETLEKLFLAAPHIPIMVLADAETEDLVTQALARGAQDYLIHDHLSSYTLARALHGAIGRKAAEDARNAAEDALFVEKERAEVTLNSIGDAVLSTDISGNITYLNLVAERMTGWRREEAIGRPLTDVFHIIDGQTHETAPNPMELAVRHNQTVSLSANSILIRRDGAESPIEDSSAPIHDRGGKLTGAVIVFHDISESRSMTQKMSHLAQHDFLTDLPNRVLLNDRLSHSIALARRRGAQLAVLFLDLDHFKHINDSLGHPIGDQLLKAVVLRLVACVRASDTVSRQGGDEFVVLLSEIEHPEDAAFIAEKMRAAVMVPYSIAKHDLHLSVSIGISVHPDDGEDAETLIKNADTAMYQAKDSGRNNAQFFRQDMNVRAVERQSVEGNLRRALERHEFVLNYQPKVDLETGAITGAEALIRWRHPERGLIFPDQFIAIAEDCGLVVPIGQWVLREACTQARAWIDAGLKFDQMAVNISAVEFRSKGFFEAVCAVLRETHLEPHYLELELTETVLMRNIESTSAVLQALNAMGVRLAVDDFGTGYSSLSYLSRFPIDTLKIDQSFVRDVTTDANDATIVSAVIAMGHSLKQRVVAEGVETSEQLAFLQSHRCDEGQGYYFSHPVLANRFTTLLETGVGKSAHHEPEEAVCY